MARGQAVQDVGVKEKVTVNNRSRKVVVVIIYVALMIDYMLTTVVVPIIPDYLIKLWTADGTIVVTDNNTVDYSETSIPVGLLFGSKSVVQIIFNMIAGPMTNRIGYSVVMFVGFILLAASTLTFAFSKAYWMMFLARSVQGIGSAFTSTGGLGLVAKMYTEETDRAKALATVLGGLALGGLVGPSYGGIMYEYGGMVLPFGILAILTLLDGGLQAIILRPKCEREDVKGAKVSSLLLDPYILITIGSLFISNMSVSSIQPTLPLWMIETWGSSSAAQGVSFLPMTLGYLINTQVFGHVSHRFGRWKCAMAGLLIIGIAAFVIPYCPNRVILIFPIFFTGMGIAIVDITMFSMLGTIVDKRHSSAYGSVFAVGDSAECLAFSAGPFLAGPFVKWFGFKYAMFFMGAINILYIPLMLFLNGLETMGRNESSSSVESIDLPMPELTKSQELGERLPSELRNASDISLNSFKVS